MLRHPHLNTYQKVYIVPKYPPKSHTSQWWKKLVLVSPREADELRSDISHIVRNNNHSHKNNLTIQEHRALTELKQDTSRVVTHSRQRGSHGHYGKTRLHQQGTGTTTRHQHKQGSQQSSHNWAQKQTHTNTQGHKTN